MCPGDLWSTTDMMHIGNDSFESTIVIPDRLGDLKFYVEVIDSFGRTVTSDICVLPVHDNDPPVLGEDGSDAVGWSGHPFLFEVGAFDNIQVFTVEVTYWIGEDQTSILMESLGGSFRARVDLPQVVGSLHYAFTVTDSSGLCTKGHSVSVDIIDVDPPEMSIEHPGTATTGDPFAVTCHLVDNIALSEAWMEWGIDGLSERLTIPLEGGGTFHATITVPHTMGTLHFMIHVVDSSDNENSSSEMTVEVVDNDAPTLVEDLTEQTAYTGQDHTIEVSVGDNIAVSSVSVTYRFDAGESDKDNLERSPSHHVLSIPVPEDARALYYAITVVDTSGNDVGTPSVIVPVLDVIPPTLTGPGDLSVRTGEPFTIAVSGHDNRDPMNVTTHLRYPGGEWKEVTKRVGVSFDASITSEELGVTTSGFFGDLQYWILVVDDSGNAALLGSADEPFVVTVVDDESPSIKLHGPTRCITGQSVTFDAGDSQDNVGIDGFTWTVEGPEESDWNGPVVETIFTKSGDYTICLVLTDASGNQATRDLDVRVDDAPDVDSSRDHMLFLVVILGVFLSTLALLVVVRR